MTAAIADTVIVPPLHLIVLFSDDVPAPIDLPAGEPPFFEAQRIVAPGLAPFPWLGEALDDASQSLGSHERTAIAGVRAALHLRCADDEDLVARVQGARDRIALLIDRGAIAVALPAAQKLAGRDEIAAALGAGGPAWMALFVHRHSVEDDDGVWVHTHGMEHFGLPDLERRAPRDDAANADRLLSEGIRHLLRHGEIGGDAPFATIAAPPVVDHEVGAWGALSLGRRSK